MGTTALLNIADDYNCVAAKLLVLERLDQLEQDLHGRLVLMKRRPEVVADNCLLAGLQLGIDKLLD